MTEGFSGWPEWLQTYLADDEAFAAAYGVVTARERAHLKLCIARLTAVFPAAATAEDSRSEVFRQGFRRYLRVCPADWMIVYCSARCAGPTRLLASLVPALAAGVESVAVCRVMDGSGTQGWPPFFLTALELAGVETVVTLPPNKAAHLARQLATSGKRGRVILMGDAAMDALSGIFRAGNVPVEHLTDTVTIGIDTDGLPPEWIAPEYGVLRRMHPDATLAPVSDLAGYDAVFCAREAVAAWVEQCRLVISPGHEAFWLWPGLGTTFFSDEYAGFVAFP